jgi:hypothetical protein
MVAMTALCETRIRYTRLLVHLVGDDLAGGVEEGRYSSGCRFHGVVDLFQSTCVTGLVLEASDQFKGSMAVTSALGSWSLEACAQRLLHYHQQRQVDSSKGAATAARWRLALVAVVVVRWSKDLDVIFTMFVMLCTYYELME